MRTASPAGRLLCAVSVAAMAFGRLETDAAGAPQLAQYRDAAGRFAFDYPAAFGPPEQGTDSGFGGRVAAIRFATFSAQGIGGEAVLLQGPPSVSVLALGGLYDDITSGALPDPVKAAVAAALPRLSAANFCAQLRAERHIDLSAAAVAALESRHREALRSLDAMGHSAPEILRCEARGDTITFHKEAAMVAGGPRRHTYGAIRFLTGQYSAFHLVRAGQAPDAPTLDRMSAVVESWRPR
jgi:hypothetical protein